MPSTDAPPCVGQTDLFFSLDYDDQQRAKAICVATCQVRAACLAVALTTGGFDRYADGIQGGFDPIERGKYRRLHGTRVERVLDLPERYRTKPPRGRGTRSAAA